MSSIPPQITEMLLAWAEGDRAAFEQLLPLIYDELRRIAEFRLYARSRGDSLNPAELVHEAYMRLSQSAPLVCNDRAHFLNVAAIVMHGILVDRARARLADKRGAGGIAVTISGIASDLTSHDPSVLDVHRALTELAKLDCRQARIVQLRFFGGLTMEEIASALRISLPTAKRDWSIAKTWIRLRLQGAT